MEETSKQITVQSVALKWGIINGFISIIFLIITDLADLIGNQYLQWLSLLIFVTLLVFAHREFKNEGNDGYMNYGQGLGIGTLLALVSGLIANVFSLIYVSFISTDFIQRIRDNQLMTLENRGMSAKEIEQAMQFSELIMTPVGLSITGLIMGIFFAFIASLIVTLFTKKSRETE